jgi:integrase
MARDNKGTVKQFDGQFYARVRWTDENTGKERDKKFLPVSSESAAWKLIHNFKEEIETEGTKSVDSSRKTFEDLADYFEENHLIQAVYANDVKIAGYRDLVAPTGQLKRLRKFFGPKRLRSITYDDLRRYGQQRRQTKRRFSDELISMATVHREYALLKKMLNIAKNELRWIPRNPFLDGKSLILPAAEKKRERLITREDEMHLLSVCTGKRAHLKPIIIFYLDTGCRRSEVLKMKWRDVDFENLTISIPLMNTKTMRAKKVAISERMRGELEILQDKSPNNLDDYIFGGIKSIKTAWKTVRDLAGLPEDTRIHDLRHVFGSRMAKKTGNPMLISRLLGHATVQMSYRYIQIDDESLTQARNLINQFNDETQNLPESIKEEFVN